MTTSNNNPAAAEIAQKSAVEQASATKAKHLLRLESIVSLAEKIKPDVIQDGNQFNIHKEVFTKNMPDDVTPESYKAAINYGNDFASASTRAVGMLAFEYLASEPGTKDAFMKASLIGGHVEATFERQRTFPAIKDGGKDIVKNGYTTIKMVNTGMKGATSVMTPTHQFLAKLAEETFLKDNS
jgi:hypothetical protein